MAYEATAPAGAQVRGDMRALRKRLDTRHGVLKAELISSGNRDWWRDIADFMAPMRGRWLTSDTIQKGKRNNVHIKDEEGILAARICTSGMMAGMSSRSRQWFRLVTKDRLLMESAVVRVWLSQVETIMRQVLHSSNFYDCMHTFYGELCRFGTAAMIIFEDYEDVLRCETLTVGEYVLAQNARRFCDTMYREFEMTCGQMDEAGFKLSPTLQAKKDRNEAGWRDSKHVVAHCISPNHDRIVGRSDDQHKPFMSVYWLQNCDEEGGGILQFKGFDENPLIACRWETTGNDTYGHGPGHVSLQAVKQLQFETRAKAKGIEKSLNPPMQGPASLKDGFVDLVPGGITYHDDRPGNKGLRQVYEGWRPDIEAVSKDITDVRRRVREIFYADLFFAISQMEGVQPRNEFELVERKEEKLVGLGPVVDRLHREALDTTIDRVWAILNRAFVAGGPLLPTAPDRLRGEQVDVDYVSPLAQAQKALGIGNIERAMGFLGNLSGAFPEARDKLNVDATVDDYFDRMALPPALVNDKKTVAAMRAARSQQEQVAQLAALAGPAKDGAAAVELLSRTDAGRPTSVPLRPY